MKPFQKLRQIQANLLRMRKDYGSFEDEEKMGKLISVFENKDTGEIYLAVDISNVVYEYSIPGTQGRARKIREELGESWNWSYFNNLIKLGGVKEIRKSPEPRMSLFSQNEPFRGATCNKCHSRISPLLYVGNSFKERDKIPKCPKCKAKNWTLSDFLKETL